MKLSSLALVAVVFALAGCSSAPKNVDTGAIRGRTFAFVNRGVAPSASNLETRQRVHGMIQDAITRNLAARGMTRVQTGGDLTVGYIIFIGNGVTTEAVTDYCTDIEAAAALQDKAHAAYTGSKNPNQFEAGTLVIEIVDGRTYKLLKRAYATRPTLRTVPENARPAQIQEVVDVILRDLRIEQ